MIDEVFLLFSRGRKEVIRLHSSYDDAVCMCYGDQICLKLCNKYGDDQDDNKGDPSIIVVVVMIVKHSYDSIDDDDDDGNNNYTDSYEIIPSVATHQFLRTPLPEVVNINTVEGAALRI